MAPPNDAGWRSLKDDPPISEGVVEIEAWYEELDRPVVMLYDPNTNAFANVFYWDGHIFQKGAILWEHFSHWRPYPPDDGARAARADRLEAELRYLFDLMEGYLGYDLVPLPKERDEDEELSLVLEERRLDRKHISPELMRMRIIEALGDATPSGGEVDE